MREKVIFDTNFLYNKRATSFFGNREELEQFVKIADIIIPEIVIEELESKYERSFGQEKDKFFKTLLPSILSHNCDSVEIETRIKELKESEDIQYRVIQLTDYDILPQIKHLAIKKLPPFEPGDGTDKGFKDTYIYFTILEYLQQIPDKSVFVCVKDQRFKKAFDSHPNIFAIENYSEFLKFRISQFQNAYFLGKAKEELGIEFNEGEVLDFWMNINENQVVLLRKSDDEFVIELDSGEIIDSSIVKEYRQSVENLINASDYILVQESVAHLIDFQHFLNEEEISKILNAAIENEHFRWQLDEPWIEEFVGRLYAKGDIIMDEKTLAFLKEKFD